MLQHVYVRGRHRERQQKQAHARGRPCPPQQQSKRTEQLADAAHPHGDARSGDIGRHDAHFQVGGSEVRDAADQEPEEHETQADALTSAHGADEAFVSTMIARMLGRYSSVSGYLLVAMAACTVWIS